MAAAESEARRAPRSCRSRSEGALIPREPPPTLEVEVILAHRGRRALPLRLPACLRLASLGVGLCEYPAVRRVLLTTLPAPPPPFIPARSLLPLFPPPASPGDG
jgi:hypothetical protein